VELQRRGVIELANLYARFSLIVMHVLLICVLSQHKSIEHV
jgi:hypothetical protein